MNNHLLITALKTCLPSLLMRHPVQLAYLYGSVATGRTTKFSDIDIALVVAPDTIKPAKRLRFELMLEDEITNQCNIDGIDVRVINDAPLALRGQVVTEGILLFASDNNFRIEFESSTRSAYFDFLPVIESCRNAFFTNIMEKGINGQSTKSRKHVTQFERIPNLSA